jgi:hypothetical protein
LAPSAVVRTARPRGDTLLAAGKVAGYAGAAVAFGAGALAAVVLPASHGRDAPLVVGRDSLAGGGVLLLFGGIALTIVVVITICIATRFARRHAGASAAALLVVAVPVAAVAAVLLAEPRLIAGTEGSIGAATGGDLTDVIVAGWGLLLTAALAGAAAALTLAASARRRS